MKSSKFTHYYIQVDINGLPEIIPHTREGDVTYHKFVQKAKALEFLKENKEKYPNNNLRLVKETVQYETTDWE